MNIIIRQIPNLFTLANVFCGCMSIIFSFSMKLEMAGYFIFIGAAFDFFDGFMARLLNAPSAIGKQLDSLADVVSFGVAPGIILFQFIHISQFSFFTPIEMRTLSSMFIASFGLLIPMFSALRLAKFNTLEDTSSDFVGLPTPAMAFFIASIPVVLAHQIGINFYYPPSDIVKGTMALGAYHFLSEIIFVEYFFMKENIIAIAILFSLLMVSPFMFISMKFKGMSWQKNMHRYIFLISCLICVIYLFLENLTLFCLPLFIVLHIVVSLIFNIPFLKNKLMPKS
jgi:CDP-diacylglycerol---serine O-phosphatidyltransferase